ncbi:hypothetical protein ACHAW5_003141 [Stephanodiscus triporus]|uniref:HSF-type DNA-binding domain-containing protein n=1 Tax=Stephanodiscus triporus TaxID=2934178 RepID=A0ABD3NWZ4_9STRA
MRRSFTLSLGIDVPLAFLQKLPHGDGFVIRHKRRFAHEVMPRHFGGRAPGTAKFTSFTRKLNRWGFKRVGEGDGCVLPRQIPEGRCRCVRRNEALARRRRRRRWRRDGDGLRRPEDSEDSEDDDEKKEDNTREDEATNTITTRRTCPSRRPWGEETRCRPRHPGLSPTQHQLQQLALLKHQQKVLQQQQQLMQQQPLAHVLSMKSTSAQQKLLLLRLHQQQLQLQIHRNTCQAETASSLGIQNLLGMDTTTSHNHQQIIYNSLSILKSHIKRGLLNIMTPAMAAGDVSRPPPAPCNVRGYVHAKMRARPREVDECDDRDGKRQRAATSLAAASSPPAVGNHAVLMSQLKRLQKVK